MSQKPTPKRSLIMDACVLIDFLKTDRYVIELVSKYIGPVHVIRPVIDEIGEIESEEELTELGMTILEPQLDDAFEAANTIGATSFLDRLCLLTAKRLGYICVTNDSNLRRQCEKENVSLLWGLQVLTELHACGGIPTKTAVDVAEQIRKNNRTMTVEVMNRYMKVIMDQHHRTP